MVQFFQEQGLLESFTPAMRPIFISRGETMLHRRCAELRKVAYSRIEALTRAAKVECECHAVRQLRQLAEDGLTSAAARALLENMPTAEQLLPPLRSLQLCNGEVVSLE